MKIIKYMMQVLVVGSLLTSCVEDADVTAYLTEDQLSNVAQDDPDKTFSAAVAGMYSDMQKYYDTDMQHNYFGQKSFDYLTSLMGNDMIMTGRFGMSLYHYLLDYWQQNYTPTNNRWKEYYRVIANANNILKLIDPSSEDPANLKYRAIALGFRGYAYLQLTYLYQHSYYTGADGTKWGRGEKYDFSQSPCVPLITEKTEGDQPRATVAQMQYINSYKVNHNIEGYFGMADYDYNNKYYISAAFRRDGTSRFLDRWGNFWSVGAAWRISNEAFMDGTDAWLNDLKIRASYGTQGNENILSDEGYAYVYTPYQDQYTVTWNGAELGYSPEFYGNPDLTWEKQKTFDVGVDFRLFDRVYGSFEYFYRRTDDMLFKRPVAFSTAGRPYNWENLGAMKNTGIEFDVNVDIFNQPDLKWTVSLVGSHYKNRILTLPEENRKDGITSGPFNLREGKSRFEYYTYMYAGMDEKGNAMWYMDETNDKGEVIGRTTTTTYAEATRYFIGKSALPDFNGGFSTTFSYKGIDLSIATAFQIGGYAYDYSYLDGMSSSFYVGHNKDMWKTFNPETGTGSLPIWNADNASNSFTQQSDLNLIKASYFSIRNITLGYTLPKNLMQKFGIEKLRIYATADNLALWSKRQGFDPRVAMAGADDEYGGYSPMRVISGGINLTF
jgi:hypothetical protein